jgi:hypothetical protein
MPRVPNSLRHILRVRVRVRSSLVFAQIDEKTNPMVKNSPLSLAFASSYFVVSLACCSSVRVSLIFSYSALSSSSSEIDAAG